MKLTKMYQLQRLLEFEIKENHSPDPALVLYKRLWATIVETAEASNEHRGFKFWSKKQVPTNVEKLLEESADIWAFGISIGVELNIHLEEVHPRKFEDVTLANLDTVIALILLYQGVRTDLNIHILKRRYQNVMEYLLGIVVAYGFTEKQLEEAYLRKNVVNHERQNTGY